MCNLNLFVADLRHVVFLPKKKNKIRKCKNTKGRQSLTLSCFCVFEFTRQKYKNSKIHQKKGDNVTRKMCRVFAFHLSAFSREKIQKCKNTKIRQSKSLSSFCIFAFSHCCIFTFSRSVCTSACAHQLKEFTMYVNKM